MASCVRHLEDGSIIEVGVVGFEGLIGVESIFGAEAQPNQVTAQIAGEVIRFDLDIVSKSFVEDSTFRALVLKFTNAFMIQIGQTAACNRRHPLEQRLARWLLMVADRTPSTPIGLTQEFLAQMLGVRTAGVNEAVSVLTASGLIRHRRQSIEIIDRPGLEAMTCECYASVKACYARDNVL